MSHASLGMQQQLLCQYCHGQCAFLGLWLFSFDWAAMVSLMIWISVRGVFACGVGFVCLCPGGCVEVAEGGWRECVCWGWKLGKGKTLEADLCNIDPTSLQSISARAWRERFLVF